MNSYGFWDNDAKDNMHTYDFGHDDAQNHLNSSDFWHDFADHNDKCYPKMVANYDGMDKKLKVV